MTEYGFTHTNPEQLHIIRINGHLYIQVDGICKSINELWRTDYFTKGHCLLDDTDANLQILVYYLIILITSSNLLSRGSIEKIILIIP